MNCRTSGTGETGGRVEKAGRIGTGETSGTGGTRQTCLNFFEELEDKP